MTIYNIYIYIYQYIYIYVLMYVAYVDHMLHMFFPGSACVMCQMFLWLFEMFSARLSLRGREAVAFPKGVALILEMLYNHGTTLWHLVQQCGQTAVTNSFRVTHCVREYITACRITEAVISSFLWFDDWESWR